MALYMSSAGIGWVPVVGTTVNFPQHPALTCISHWIVIGRMQEEHGASADVSLAKQLPPWPTLSACAH